MNKNKLKENKFLGDAEELAHVLGDRRAIEHLLDRPQTRAYLPASDAADLPEAVRCFLRTSAQVARLPCTRLE